MFSATAFGLFLLAADPAATVSEAPAPVLSEGADVTASSDKDRLICRRESRPNTRFTSKVCEEWEKRSKAAQEAFEYVRGRPS